MKRGLGVLAVALFGMVAFQGCRTVQPDAHERVAREIPVSGRGSSISVKVDAAGGVETEVFIPEGSPGAGTYRSTNPALQEDATDAKNALNEPGGVTVLVDESGQIVGFGRVAAR